MIRGEVLRLRSAPTAVSITNERGAATLVRSGSIREGLFCEDEYYCD
jgi:hypothetical protein